jgi:hypothetical protein
MRSGFRPSGRPQVDSLRAPDQAHSASNLGKRIGWAGRSGFPNNRELRGAYPVHQEVGW